MSTRIKVFCSWLLSLSLILSAFSGVTTVFATESTSFTRMEAEVFGETSTYKSTISDSSYSGGYAYGSGFYNYYTAFKTDAEMLAGNYDDKIANVKFNVKADVAGTKQIRVGYKAETDSSAASSLEKLNTQLAGKLIYVIVKNAYGATGYPVAPDTDLDISVAKGDNTIIVSTFSYQIYEKYIEIGGIPTKIWTNIDYIDIGDGLTKVYPKSLVGVIAEAEEYGEAYNYPATEKSSSYSGGLALAQGAYGYSKIPYQEDYFNSPEAAYANQPHAVYTVEAETTGTYSLTSGYRFGTNGKYPTNIYTYLIVTDGNNVTTTYQQNGSGNWVDVQLTKGKNTVVATIFDRETYYLTMGGGQGSTWINMDYLGLYSEAFQDFSNSDLEYAIRPLMPEGADAVDSTAYTRFEAETDAYYDAYTNKYKSVSLELSNGYGRSVPNNLHLNAQTKAQIETSGIDTVLTPTVTYYITVEKEDNYEIINGFVYTVMGESLPDSQKAFIAIAANDVVQIKELEVADSRAHYANVVSTVHLKEGRNKVQITCATGDSVSADALSSVAVYHDYLDIKDLNATITAPSSYIEAEDSLLHNYSVTADRGTTPSGANKGYAGGEAYSKVVNSSVTFEKLNIDTANMLSVPFVEYRVVVPETGVYPIKFLGWIGWNGYIPSHDTFVGISVNGEKFEKLKLRVYSTYSAHFSRTADIQLNKGENVITLTGMLADFVTNAGNRYWIDHDCIVLPGGVTSLPCKEIIAGDITDDGKVDLLDLLRYKTYLASSTTPVRIINSDVDNDGLCNADDLVSLQQLLLDTIKS